MDWKLELVTIPVSDVDRAKAFYVEQAGFVADHDHLVSDGLRFVQLTPPGSACSIAIGEGLTESAPGSAQAQLVVADVHGARDALRGRGLEVGEVQTFPWGSFVFFTDLEGNRWAVQQLPQRGRAVPTVPTGYTAVTPWVVSKDTARLLEFATQAFDAEEIARLETADGSIAHAEFRIGDAIIMAFDAKPSWPEAPAFLRLYVEDGDETFRRALAAGAAPVTEMTDLFFGDRVGRVRDPLGNVWWIQTRVEELTPEEMQARATDARYAGAMEYVERSLDAAMRGS
jgi:uncharacterized glyoxalase superfamily protein PhnB